MDGQLERAIRNILNDFDDGVRCCVGIESSGNMVWKGSFIADMERLRELMPPDRDDA